MVSDVRVKGLRMFGFSRLSMPDYKKFRFRILVFRIFGFARAPCRAQDIGIV